MSLDFELVGEKTSGKCHGMCNECGERHEHSKERTEIFFSTNITHNLRPMFEEAGVYRILWHGDGLLAASVVDKLEEALSVMDLDRARFEKYDAPNGCGKYVHAVQWLSDVIDACNQHKNAVIRCLR